MVTVPRRSVLALGASGLTLAACAPGGGSDQSSGSAKPAADINTDAKSLGKVTLTVWDQEVRGGQKQQMETLIGQFEKKYPNIKIKRVSRSFDDLSKTLRLAMNGDNAPDVVQANNTRSQMGKFVKAKQIVSLDNYAKAYGWDDRFSDSIRSVSSYSPDATTFGSGQLYGVPQVGEVVGIYYNADKLKKLGIKAPKTWAEFDKALATAKSKGEVPLAFGNLEKWPAAHVFGLLQGRYTDAKAIRTLGFGESGGDWESDSNLKAASAFRDLATKGYFAKGFNGQGYDPAWQAFSKGTGVFLIAGTWLQADLAKAMGDAVRFTLPPAPEGGDIPLAPGGTGLPFAITSKAKKPDAAAAYLDFITSPEAMKILTDTGNLPVSETSKQKAPDRLATDVFDAFSTISTDDGLLPYLDWATPTMGDTIGAALQGLLAGKASAEATLKTLATDYQEFTAK
ncbi:extracellular solute-binding protein [Demetria terragena]|uniref:extracellular solute-binding protein n=1 Tax=Demetria terragena TaxID=63959 RepID=UPI0003648692|nr:extracellular solute-binding protein [Demetria terragena]